MRLPKKEAKQMYTDNKERQRQKMKQMVTNLPRTSTQLHS